jgi:hypothetical protein
MTKTRVLAGIGVAGALLLTGGCGKAADKIAERAAEEAIENSAGGGEVDISGDGSFSYNDGNVSYETDADGNMVMKGPDGEVITADADGNMTMSGEDGETTYTTGENAELPAGWPDFLALPGGSTLMASTTTTEGGVKVGNITAELEGAVSDAYEGFKSALEDEGFEIGSDSFTESSDGDFASLSGDKGDQSVSITIGGGGDAQPYLSMTFSGL